MYLAGDTHNDLVETLSFFALPLLYLALGMYLRRTNNLPSVVRTLVRAHSRSLYFKFEACEAISLLLLMLFESGTALIIYASDSPPEALYAVVGLFLIPHYLFALLALRYYAIVLRLSDDEGTAIETAVARREEIQTQRSQNN